MKKNIASVILFFTDALFLFLSVIFVYFIRLWFDEYFSTSLSHSIWLYMYMEAYYLSILIGFLYLRIYTAHFDFFEEMRRVYKGLFVGLLITILWITITKQMDFSRFILFANFALLAFILPIEKRIVKNILVRNGLWQKKVSVVCNEKNRKMIENEMKSNWYMGLSVCKQSDSSLIFSSDFSKDETEKIVNRLLMINKEIFIIPTIGMVGFVGADISEVHNLNISMVRIKNNLKNIFAQVTKRFLDLFVSILSLPFLLPIFAVIAVIIKFDSKGGVFFFQTRLGKDSKVFWCIKFRTMSTDPQILQQYLLDNPDEKTYYQKYHKYKNDPRITKIGRWLRRSSFDELPQIFNVLMGQMSFIGPRPYMTSERKKLKLHKEDILFVRPGITGLWQVQGRNDRTFEDRINIDKWYVRNWSLWMDFVIFLKTLKVFFMRQGVS